MIAAFGGIDAEALVGKLAEGLTKSDPSLRFVFRRHPRDNISYEEYRRIFADAGIEIIDTNSLDTNEVGAASDLVITSSSTEALNGIYRRKPTMHVIDRELDRFKSGEVPPPVMLGASVGIFDFADLRKKVEEILNRSSQLYSEISKNMQDYYPSDGKNAERVAKVVNRIIEKGKLDPPG